MIERAGDIFEPFGKRNTAIMLALEDSDWGRELVKQERYGRYMALPEDTDFKDLDDETKKEYLKFWAEYLIDTDVNNLQHNPHTALIAQAAGRLDSLPEQTIDTAVSILLVHDAKEARLSDGDEGDITYDEAIARGTDHLKQEHFDIADMLKSGHFPMFTDEEADRVALYLNDSKRHAAGLGDPESAVGQLVEIAERVGYQRAALSAYEAIDRVATDRAPTGFNHAEQGDRLLWLAENATSNHLRRLIELADHRASTRYFLEANEAKITALLDSALESWDTPMDYYLDYGQSVGERWELFDATLEAWDEYLATRQAA